MFLALLLAGQLAAPGAPGRGDRECRAEDLALQRGRAQLLAEGYDAATVLGDALMPDRKRWPGDHCPTSSLMRWALIGWVSARQLASKGGTGDLLATTRRIIDQELAALGADDLTLEVEYAQTAIRAAISAAQDERPEMELLLVHARDLTERLIARGRRPVWPRPYNLLAAELWLEVDRYEEALAAYERAAGSEASPVAMAGLARTHARLGNQAAACAAYQKVRDVPPLREEAGAFLARCP
jgi:tetratricopeptide (TPR) repeat protein